MLEESKAAVDDDDADRGGDTLGEEREGCSVLEELIHPVTAGNREKRLSHQGGVGDNGESGWRGDALARPGEPLGVA